MVETSPEAKHQEKDGGHTKNSLYLFQALLLFDTDTLSALGLLCWVKTHHAHVISCSFTCKLLLLTMENEPWLPGRVCTTKKPFSEFN